MLAGVAAGNGTGWVNDSKWRSGCEPNRAESATASREAAGKRTHAGLIRTGCQAVGQARSQLGVTRTAVPGAPQPQGATQPHSAFGLVGL